MHGNDAIQEVVGCIIKCRWCFSLMIYAHIYLDMNINHFLSFIISVSWIKMVNKPIWFINKLTNNNRYAPKRMWMLDKGIYVRYTNRPFSFFFLFVWTMRISWNSTIASGQEAPVIHKSKVIVSNPWNLKHRFLHRFTRN